LAQVLLQFRNCSIAFSLVACCDDEDERLGLRARLEEFVDQAGSDTQAQAAECASIGCV
jgi:hypothetical protein